MQRVLNQEEIDAIVQAARGQTSVAVAKEQRSLQSCDFRQAGQLSRELVQAVNGLFEGFARNLSQSLGMYLPVPIQTILVSVEQLAYKDFLVRTSRHWRVPSCHRHPNPPFVPLCRQGREPGILRRQPQD